MAELKTCPFCGRMPIVENCNDFGYFVKCKCGIEQSTLYAQKCDAIKRWNNRKADLKDKNHSGEATEMVESQTERENE